MKSSPIVFVLQSFASNLLRSGRDLFPIVAIIAVFQAVILRLPFPDLAMTLLGLLFVLVGLALFVLGLDIGIFPIGESMAEAFARKGSLFWLLLFAFALGFGTTIAEPALIAVALEGAQAAGEAGLILDTEDSIAGYALGVRITVAVSVGCAIVLGVLRILRGWSLPKIIISGYVVVMIMTMLAPEEIIGLAYDSGGVTTSTVTVPLVTALGVGLANTIRGRDPMIDGFGLIALASLFPMIFVMGYGILG
jgi:hypothetical protein